MRIAGRVLPILQLTRMALVFTAIADSMCSLLLQCEVRDLELTAAKIICVVLISTGLYGFGMSLNDIIDRKRDASVAGHRPLPSGRIGVLAAHIIATSLGIMAVAAGAVYSHLSFGGWRSLILVVWTGSLISFYDFAGKYLVAPGLLTLGLIRFFHAAIPSPGAAVVWQPLWLFNHVTILSTVAYVWEGKRPLLTAGHWRFLAGCIALVNAMVIVAVWAHRAASTPGNFFELMCLTPALLWPIAATFFFLLIALFIRSRNPNPREAGQKLMLYGLLWLIVYDAAFLAGYVNWTSAVSILALLPLAYLSVRAMRWWSSFVSAIKKPAPRREER